VTHATRDRMPLRSRPAVVGNAIWNRHAAAATRRILADWKPSIVHAHKLYPQLSVAPIVAASRAGVPVVQTLHDFELVSAGALDARGGWRDEDETRASYRLVNSATHPVRRLVHVRRVTAFVAVSRFVAGVYGRHGIEATVLPNFVARQQSNTPNSFSERSGIAFAGRLTRDKGILDILSLAAALPDVPVTVMGTGLLEGEVRARATALPNLTLTGFVDPTRVVGIVNRARLLVLPSRCHEAGSLAAVEAMSVGTPVVAYASGGLSEYVADAGAGLVVPRDPVTLAIACRRLLNDQAAWERMSADGLKAAQTTHAPDRYLDSLERLYAALLTHSS